MESELPQLRLESLEETYVRDSGINQTVSNRTRRVVRTLIVIGLIVALWEIVSRSHLVSPETDLFSCF
jgi:hypothetical protein